MPGSGLLSKSGVSSVLSGGGIGRAKFGGSPGKKKLRRPLMAGAHHGPSSDDYGFVPLEDEVGPSAAVADVGVRVGGAGSSSAPRDRASDGRRGNTADGYESSRSIGSCMSARSLGSMMRRGGKKIKKKTKKEDRKKSEKARNRGDGGFKQKKKSGRRRRRRRNSGSTGVNASLVQCLSDRYGSDDERDPDHDDDDDDNDNFSSSIGSPWSCLSFFSDTATPAGSGSFPPSPSPRGTPTGHDGGGTASSKRSPHNFLFPASPSSLWKCATTATTSSERDGDAEGNGISLRRRGGGGSGNSSGGQPVPKCCSPPRIGPDGHALAAAVAPVPTFMHARGAHSRGYGGGIGNGGAIASSSSVSSSAVGGGGAGGGGGRRSDRGSDEGSSADGDGGGSWVDVLAGAAVFGTGAAARAAGAAANGGCVAYSSRSAVTDGGEPQPGGGSTVMERRALRPNGSHLSASHWSDGNRRGYMEDRYAIEPMGTVTISAPVKAAKDPLALKHSPSPRGVDELALVPSDHPFDFDPDFPREHAEESVVVPATFYGVYDGHGGPNASQYCSDWMATYVRRQHSWPLDPSGALSSAFDETDEDFVASGHLDGTTVCVALVLGSEQVVCANAGDSRCVVVRRDGSAAKLSRDHKPGTPDETRRIAELGGRVMYMGGRWRVEGSLAVSRGVGDAALKPYVCSTPELVEYSLDEDDLFLVIATDGVWDVLENEYVANIVLRKATTASLGERPGGITDPVRLRAISRRLCDEARRQGSSDNLCAIVVDLKSSVHPLSRPNHW